MNMVEISVNWDI